MKLILVHDGASDGTATWSTTRTLEIGSRTECDPKCSEVLGPQAGVMGLVGRNLELEFGVANSMSGRDSAYLTGSFFQFSGDFSRF
jgi:hypothetical protein